MSLSNSCQEDKLSINVVKASLPNEEMRRKEMGTSSQSEANMTQDPNRGGSKQRGSQNRDKSKGRSKSRGKFTCFYCGKLGHFQKNC